VNKDGRIISFGVFRLDLASRMLHEGDIATRLGPRAFVLLAALLEPVGKVMSHEELTTLLWPNEPVDASALRVHVSALRKLLGEKRGMPRYLVNDHGRGYALVVPFASPVAPDPRLEPKALPERLNLMLGRQDAEDTLTELVAARRLVTITGTGGLGKSTLAVAVAGRVAGRFADGVHLLDLTSIADGGAVDTYVMSALGLERAAVAEAGSLAAAMSDRQLLLVLDNCEHLVDAAAMLVESLLAEAPGIHVLGTSREALRVSSERVYRLAPLAIPEPDDVPDLAAALTYPAIRLFVDRATAAAQGLSLSDADVPTLIELCQRLDGIPLALELAAAWVEFFGLRDLADQIDGRFLAHAEGRRTAEPRHRTLLSTLDWSFDALPPDERRVLARLSTFRGSFTLASAVSVAGADPFVPGDILRCLPNLVAKSLLNVDPDGDIMRYRMLMTTREYAWQKLEADPQFIEILKRHALNCTALLSNVEDDLRRLDRTQWLRRYGAVIGDTRAALDWALSVRGDPNIGLRLTYVSSSFGDKLGLHEEYLQRIETALTRLTPVPSNGDVDGLRLRFERAHLSHHIHGESSNFSATAQIAANQRDATDMVRPEEIISRWAAAFVEGDYTAALVQAEWMERLAAHGRDAPMRVVAERIKSQPLHFLGEHARAKELALRVLASPHDELPASHVNHKVSMRIVLSRVAWLEGNRDEALALSAEALAFAEPDTAISAVQALGAACIPIALWCDDLELAERNIALMSDIAIRNGLNVWRDWAVACGVALAARTLEPSRPVVMPTGIQLGAKLHDMLPTFDARFLSETAIERAGDGRMGWSTPEILRLKALRLAKVSPAQSQALLGRARDLAVRQGASAWLERIDATLAEQRSAAAVARDRVAVQ
jgi:predicted ATPase